jgi:hypothetical protein
MYEKMCDRIRELVKAITEGPDAVRREFYMSVPARPDRDADLVLSAAVGAIATLEAQLSDAEAKHLKAFEDGIETVRRANAQIAALDAAHKTELAAALKNWKADLDVINEALGGVGDHSVRNMAENRMRELAAARAETEELRSALAASIQERLRRGDELAALRAQLAAAEAECERLSAVFAQLNEWCCIYGKRLCPPGADTYGEGIRDAHTQVGAILNSVFGDLPLRARPDDGRVERVRAALIKNFADAGLRFNAPDTADRITRAVLAAADGAERGGR